MKIANIIIGFIFGIIVTGTTIWLIMPGMMLTERASPFSLDETIEKISSNAQAEGWIVSSIQPLHKSVKNHGGGNLSPVILINLGYVTVKCGKIQTNFLTS